MRLTASARRAGGREDAPPVGELVAVDRLADARHVGQRRQARTRDRERLQPPALTCAIAVPSTTMSTCSPQQPGDRLRAALERHVHDVDAGHRAQQLEREMARGRRCRRSRRSACPAAPSRARGSRAIDLSGDFGIARRRRSTPPRAGRSAPGPSAGCSRRSGLASGAITSEPRSPIDQRVAVVGRFRGDAHARARRPRRRGCRSPPAARAARTASGCRSARRCRCCRPAGYGTISLTGRVGIRLRDCASAAPSSRRDRQHQRGTERFSSSCSPSHVVQ